MKDIKLIAYDFDGVMTDNHVYVDENGKESVKVNRGDGLGVGLIKKLGIEQVIISTEVNNVVEMRAKKLDIPVIHGVKDKRIILIKYCEEKGIELKDAMFIGNDLNDLEAIEAAGVGGAPADAEPEILKAARWISAKKGGDGVIRELARVLFELRSM